MTDKRITGVMIYYYFVCKRKLWYFCHEINMESENENVQLGKLLDEKSYERDEKHINIDEIESMKKEEFPPKFTEQKICKKCAYHDLCFI